MITAHGPISRHITEYLTDQRVKHYKCKTLQNPDFYFDGRVYGSVDAAHKYETATDKAGGLFLRAKGIVSVGTKKADDAYKLFGLRPDENQNGSESVEWSVESIEINGKAQTVNLQDRLEISPITTKFGDNLYVQRARQRCRIMVLGDSTTESFKITLRLHLKGCTVTYRQDLDEYWIYRGSTFFCRLGRPYLVDTELNPIEGDFVRHSLVEIGKGEFRYTKEPTTAFSLANLPASYLIDADTVYSSTADGTVRRSGLDNTWAACHNATSGTDTYTTRTSYNTAMFVQQTADPLFNIHRSFFYYDLSLLSGTVASVVEYIYGYVNTLSDVAVMKGTQAASLTNNDFDNRSGSEYCHVTWQKDTYNGLTYNSTGIADVQAALGSLHKTCALEYTHDYLDNGSIGSGVYYANGAYFTEDADAAKHPYVYITMGAATSYIHGIMGHHFIPSFMGGR